MKPLAAPSLDPARKAADAAASAAPKPDPATARAARDFEAIFVRKLLSSLERSSKISGAGSSGSDMYGTMMVGALADAVASAGGIGLAPTILHAMTPRVGGEAVPPPKAPKGHVPPPSIQGFGGTTVPGADRGGSLEQAPGADLARRVHPTSEEG